MGILLQSHIFTYSKSKRQKEKILTASGSISAGNSILSKQRPEIVQTKSSFVGSIITSLHVSSQTAQRGRKTNIVHS